MLNLKATSSSGKILVTTNYDFSDIDVKTNLKMKKKSGKFEDTMELIQHTKLIGNTDMVNLMEAPVNASEEYKVRIDLSSAYKKVFKSVMSKYNMAFTVDITLEFIPQNSLVHEGTSISVISIEPLKMANIFKHHTNTSEVGSETFHLYARFDQPISNRFTSGGWFEAIVGPMQDICALISTNIKLDNSTNIDIITPSHGRLDDNSRTLMLKFNLATFNHTNLDQQCFRLVCRPHYDEDYSSQNGKGYKELDYETKYCVGHR